MQKSADVVLRLHEKSPSKKLIYTSNSEIERRDARPPAGKKQWSVTQTQDAAKRHDFFWTQPPLNWSYQILIVIEIASY